MLPYVEIPEDLSADDLYEAVLDATVKPILNDILSDLRDKERDVLELRYGLKDGKARTLEEVGAFYEVTRERVRQIETKALRKLAHTKRAEKLREFW